MADFSVAQVVATGNRRARGIATKAGVESVVDTIEIGDVGRAVDAGVATPVDRRCPVPADAQLPIKSYDGAERVHFLVEIANPGFQQPAALQQQILTSR